MNPPHPLMTANEVAAAFRVEPKTVTRWSLLGKLPSIRTPGGDHRYYRAEVEALLTGDPLAPERITELREQFLDGAL